MLVYLLASRLFSFARPAAAAAARRAGAIVAALVFGIHPLRVESVGWITDRGDVLCATFYLLAVLAYVRFALGKGRERRRWLIASLAAFAAALLSKEIAMTLPLSLLLLDAYPLRRWAQGLRAVVMEKAGCLSWRPSGPPWRCSRAATVPAGRATPSMACSRAWPWPRTAWRSTR